MKRYSPLFVLLLVSMLILCATGIYVYMRTQTISSQPQDVQDYVLKGNKVYYRTIMQVGENGSDQVYDSEMKDADTQTFIAIDPYWAKDNDSLFYMGQLVTPQEGSPSIDLPSFTLVQKSNGLGKDVRAVYVVSPNQSGWMYKAISEADPATFILVEGGPYAKDKNNVYYLDLPFEVRKIEGAEGSSFVVLGQCAAVEVSRAYYGWDNKSVVAGDKILPGVDRNTFKALITDQMVCILLERMR